MIPRLNLSGGKFEFIGERWNGEPFPKSSYLFYQELYYDHEKKRYILYTQQGIGSFPKEKPVVFMTQKSAVEYAYEKLDYDDFIKHFGKKMLDEMIEKECIEKLKPEIRRSRDDEFDWDDPYKN